MKLRHKFGIAGLVIVFGGILVTSFSSSVVVLNEITEPETKTVVETVEVDATEARIKAAQDAQMERINSEADAMREAAIKAAEEQHAAFIANELLEIEADVLVELEQELKARRTDVEKATGEY